MGEAKTKETKMKKSQTERLINVSKTKRRVLAAIVYLQHGWLAKIMQPDFADKGAQSQSTSAEQWQRTVYLLAAGKRE